MKKKILVIVSVAVSIFIAIFLYNAYSVPVLMYHSIARGAENSRLIVSPESFERQMRFLKKGNYHILSMDEYVALLKENKKPDKRSVVITFDDGFVDNYTDAYPVLKKYKMPATISVVPEWVGKQDMMRWEQIKELNDDELIEIVSHGLSHCPLDTLSKEFVIKELSESKRILEKKLDTVIDYFCYPCGNFNPFVKEMAKLSGYKAALATHPDAKISLNDTYAIRRIRISQSSDNMLVFWVQVSGYYTFFKDRRIKRK
ncbi:MAG: polysaccharide deacetylase family protein [Candidatus Omnitrophica bacterium]|nr:polysaccharide deacetylase family protein [Candidatus Omnitrophota bacterium]